MSIHYFKTRQLIPISLEKAWDFFSNPENLFLLTPPAMRMELTNGKPAPMYAGQVFTYKVRPLAGIPVSWMTEITHVKDREFFVDEQRFGPFALWHHQHHFKEVEGGVEMIDLVHYKVPWYLFGDLANALVVKNKLKAVFDYRFKRIIEEFGSLG